jgi:hypothetical protein
MRPLTHPAPETVPSARRACLVKEVERRMLFWKIGNPKLMVDVRIGPDAQAIG